VAAGKPLVIGTDEYQMYLYELLPDGRFVFFRLADGSIALLPVAAGTGGSRAPSSRGGAPGKVVSERPGERLSAILDRYDFRAVAREDVAGRAAIVLEFQPRPGDLALEGDRYLRRLGGRIWVDESEQETSAPSREPCAVEGGLRARGIRVVPVHAHRFPQGGRRGLAALGRRDAGVRPRRALQEIPEALPPDVWQLPPLLRGVRGIPVSTSVPIPLARPVSVSVRLAQPLSLFEILVTIL
jgi:hypothetical protein